MSNATLQLGGGNFAVKDGKLLGYATDPKTSVFVSREFDFSRGSNLAATRVDANGLIEKGRENLLVQSNQFDTTWQAIDAGVNGGQTGYDNSSNAWLLREIATSGFHYIRQASVITSGVGTFSFYAKKKDYDYIQFAQSGDGGNYANFNLVNGTLGNSNSAFFIDRKIESVGNGWYRCSVTYSFNSGAYVGIALIRSDVSNRYDYYGGDITKGTYIQDAQLEYGLVATDYIETGATTVQAGILENMPRIDYTNSSSPSLLLEPQRTNLIAYSESMTSSTWVGGQTTAAVVLSSNLSPEGKRNCYQVTRSSSGTTQVGFFTGVTNGSTYTASIYIRSVSGGLSVILKDVNGAGTTKSITTDWTRIDLTSTATSTTGRLYLQLISDGDVVEIYGAQLEEGSYATSYIPTYGTAVTRSEDVGAQFNFSNFFNGYDFTMFLELADNDSLLRASSANNFRISDTGGNNFGAIRIYRASASATKHRVVFQDNSQNFSPSSVEIDGDSPKVLVRRIYNTGEFKVFVNGVLKLTDTNTDYDMFRFIDFAGGGSSMTIKQIALFQTALTDSECIALTTL